MFAAIRALSKSWFAVILFSVLIVAFALFGIQDVFKGSLDTWVIKAGSRTVDQNEFKRRYELQRKQLEQENGPISIEVAVMNGLDRQILNLMAGQESMLELIRRMGIRISDAQLAAELRKNPALFNPVNGKFDPEIYQQQLAQQDLTPAVYEGLLRDDKSAQQLFSALAFGFRAPRIYTSWIGAYALEQRDVSLLTVDETMVPAPAAPTEAELQAFLKTNIARFTKPEERTFAVAVFSPAGLEAQAKIDPAEVQKRFDFRKETLAKPETRTYVQISAADAAQAEQIADRLAKGEDLLTVSGSLKRPLTTLADKPKTAIPDAKIADAVFALHDGQTSSPIQGQLGYVVVRLMKTTPGVAADFNAEKPKIEAEIRSQYAQDKVEEEVQAFDTAHSGGMSLAAAAAKAGAKVETFGPVNAQGLPEDGAPKGMINPAFVKAAFAQAAGTDSEIADAGGGVSFAVHVDKVTPATPMTLDQVRPQVTAAVKAGKVHEAVVAKADALAARLRKGEKIDAVAKDAGSKIATIRALDRLRASQDPEVNKAVPQAVMAQMFEAKPGEVFTADGGGQRVIVGHLDAVRPGDQAAVAHVIEQQRPRLTSQVFNELQTQMTAQAQKVIKTKTNLARARSAIGVDADLAAKADGKPAPKA